MLPGDRPEGRLVVGYSFELPYPAPTYDDACELAMLTRKLTREKLQVNGGCTDYASLVDWSEPMDTSTLNLGVTVDCAYGDPDVVTFTVAQVRKAFTKLEQLVAQHRKKDLCAKLHEAHPYVPADLFDGEPVIEFLFISGDGQSAADLVVGTYGEVQHDGEAWTITVKGDAERGRKLTVEANERFGGEDDLEDASWALQDWLNEDDQISTHGRLDWGTLGFLVVYQHVTSLLEGSDSSTVTLDALDATVAAHPGAKLVIRTEFYG